MLKEYKYRPAKLKYKMNNILKGKETIDLALRQVKKRSNCLILELINGKLCKNSNILLN